ncbi:MAG: VWA domain-containing protein [Sandaracinaceae bacterium]|nr:VWA domain-containing protein [Sandaracinaceae bacterium]
MGFEAPLALLAVLLAGAPVAVHLIKQRDLPTRTLPTVALLRAAQADSRQRMRLADVLLLLVRVLALALLLGCLARPYSVTSATANADQAIALAVVLDDSASMGARRDDGSVFEAALARVYATLDELPPSSEVVVVLAGTPPLVLVPRTTDLDYARTRLATVRPGGMRADLALAVEAARRELSGAASPDARLLLISDMRQGDVPELGLAEPRGTVFEVVTVTPSVAPNIALRDVLVTPSYESDDQLLVQATVARTRTDAEPDPDHASTPLAVTMTVLDAQGALLGESEVSLDAGAATMRLALPRPTTAPAPVVVRVRTSGDALAADDERSIDLVGRPAARVGIINGSPHRSPHLDEVTFLRAALDTSSDSALTIDASMLDTSAIETSTLDALDVVILANVASLTRAQGVRLEAFVRDGGSVLVTAGDQVEVASYAAALPACLPGRLEPASAAPEGALVGDSPFLSVPTPGIRRRLVLATLERDARSLLRYQDGSPALAGRGLGAGRCAVLTTTIDLAWGDLALSGEFIALLQQTLRWLLGSRRPTAAPRAGEPVELAVPSRAASVVVTTPDDREETVPPSGLFTNTRLAGRYVVRVDGVPSDRLGFTVAVDPLESDLRTGVYEPVTSAQDQARSARARRRSWIPYLLLLAALAIAAEGVIRTRRAAAVV